jgi:hypothetical protein
MKASKWIAAATVLVACAQQATAGSWVFKPSLDGGPHLWEYHHDDSDYSHLSDTSPPAPHPRNVPYSVTLYNPTRWTIAYGLNDRREPRLKPGESVRWTIMGSRENPAVFQIAFDNGLRRTVSYRLENNASFTFADTGNGLNLYKRR